MSDMQVQIELKAKDSLSKQAGTALDAVGKAARQLADAIDSVGKGNSIQKMGQDATQAARSMDAVGREGREAGQEIKTAERNATALQRSLSKVRDVARDATTHMAKMGKGLSSAGRGAVAVGGGAMAAGYVAKSALEKPVDREKALLDAANIAYGGSDATGAAKLDRSVRKANEYGGGSYESAFATQKALFAAGFDAVSAEKLLPHIQRTATATDSKGEDLAKTITAGIKSGQFTEEQAPLVLGMMSKSGAEGSYEVKNMGNAMPGVFTNTPDMKGVKGTAYHLANMQVMSDASGSPAEAETLYENVNAFRTSPEAMKNLKKNHVNIAKAMDEAAAKEEDVTFAFADAIQQGVVEKDKKYRKLKQEWQKAQGAEKAALERRMSVRQGLLFGKIIGDRQARQGAIALVNGKERRAELIGKIQDNPLAVVDEQYNRIQSSTWAKATDAANTKDNAVYDAFLGQKDTIDTGISGVSSFFKDNPVAATLAAEGGIAAQTAAAGAGVGGAAWAGLKYFGGGPAQSAAQGTTALSWGARAGEATARGVAKTAPVLALAGSAYEIYSTESDATLTRNEKNIANMETYGGFGGALAGTAMGATAGSAIPGVGTVVGAIIGGLYGYFAGGKAGKVTGQMIWDEEDDTPQSANTASPTAQQPPPQPIIIEQRNVFEVDGAVLFEVVNRNNAIESRRH